MFDRITKFFNSRKKKSSSRQHSSASTDVSSPTSPLSPNSLRSEDEDELKTPTLSRKDSELTAPYYAETSAGAGEALSRSSSHSASSMASLLTPEAELPFAENNSSGRSSVRQVHVCRVSTASSEKNSGNVTPTTLDLATDTYPSADSSTEPGFTESVVEEVSKRLQVHLEESSPKKNNEDSSEKNAVKQTTTSTFKTSLSKASEALNSPNLTSICLASKTRSIKVGEKGHTTVLKGITLGSQSSTSHVNTTQQVDEDSQKISTENSGTKRRAQVYSWEKEATEQRRSPETEQMPRSDSPVQLHKAIWVETHLGEEEEVEKEGETGKDIMTEEEEGFRADSPPVLAIPVTVIPEDNAVTQDAPDSPSTPSETLPNSGIPPESAISLAATVGEFQTTSPQPEGPDTGRHSKQTREKHSSSEIRITRKTVNLPSKHKVFANKVCVSKEQSLDGNKLEGEEYSKDSTSETSDKTEVNL